MFTKEWHNFLSNELNLIELSGRYKEESIFTGPQGIKVKLKRRWLMATEYEVINFCANNYLGLADNEEIKLAAAETIKNWGNGMASVRFICGTNRLHRNLEEAVAKFLGTESAITYTSCFDANTGLFETLSKNEGTPDANMAIISDELNHASVIDGIRLCNKVQKWVYKHNDMRQLEKGLERCLQEAQSCQLRIIATDGVFSMDGEIAKLKEICDLAEKYNAMVIVDDSHATGFIGARGRGSIEHCGVMGKVDIITGTFGKALGGGAGGFTAGPQDVTRMLRQRSRPYLFSNSLPPAACASALKALEIVDKYPELRTKIQENTLYFRKNIQAMGFEIKGENHPIVPIMIRDPKLAQGMARILLEHGILVVAFSFPVVPKGEDRIRVQISAAHEKSHLKKALVAFHVVGKELGIIK